MHCLANAGPGRRKMMSLKTFYAAIDVFDGKSFNVCGGEPSLHEDLDEILPVVCEKSMYPRIVTNAEWWITGNIFKYPDFEDEEEMDCYCGKDEDVVFMTEYEGLLTYEAIKFARIIRHASNCLIKGSSLTVHISDDRFHREFISYEKLKMAKMFLEYYVNLNCAEDTVNISIDNNIYNRYILPIGRYILPIGRGREYYDPLDERGLDCICEDKLDVPGHFEERMDCLNVFCDGQVSQCEAGKYMFANVLEHSYDEIRRRFAIVHEYMQTVFAKCVEDGESGVDSCIICQENFPVFKKHILPKVTQNDGNRKISFERADAR